MRVIFDTNFMLIPAQFRVDIFTEVNKILLNNYELFVLDRTVDELKTIVEKQSGKHKDAAKIALQLLDKVEIITTGEGHVDDLLVNEVDSETIICTQDQDLKKRVKEKGGKIITLRQKTHLIAE